jgi:hypothetical protein
VLVEVAGGGIGGYLVELARDFGVGRIWGCGGSPESFGAVSYVRTGGSVKSERARSTPRSREMREPWPRVGVDLHHSAPRGAIPR